LQVLNQSYRIPKTIFAKSNKIVDRIKKRIPKTWKPRQDQGVVKNTNFDNIKLNEGNWLILARTNHYINRIAEEVKNRGHLFEKNNRLSIKQEVLNAYRAWKNLQKGKEIHLFDVKYMYQYMALGESGVVRGKKLLLGSREDVQYSYEILCKDWGLKVNINTPWDIALQKISEYERIYIKQILNSGHDLDKEASIKLSTIHGAKGGESENVILFSDISKRISDNMWINRDDERRVFYVGLTRAKNNLYIIPSTTTYEFEEILR
jgi:DNA helicase-2/ATP-dependent DNA helicase PcrA